MVVTPAEVVRDVRRPVSNVDPAKYMHWNHQRRVAFVCRETMGDDVWVVTDELEHAPEAGTLLDDVGSVLQVCTSRWAWLRNDMLCCGISDGKILQ